MNRWCLARRRATQARFTLACLLLGVGCSARPDRPAPASNAPVHVPPIGADKQVRSKAPRGAPAAACSRTTDAPGCFLSTPDGLWVQRAEVDEQTHERCVQEGACSPISRSSRPRDTQPVTHIDHAGATALCAWLDARLPTRAEWTTLARGGDARPFPWGTTPACPTRSDGPPAVLQDPQVLSACAAPLAELEAQYSASGLDDLAGILGTRTAPEIIALCTAPGTSAQRAAALWALRQDLDHSACRRAGPMPPSRLRTGHPWQLLGLAGNVAEWTSEVVEGRAAVAGGSFHATSFDAYRTDALKPMALTTVRDDIGVRCVYP